MTASPRARTLPVHGRSRPSRAGERALKRRAIIGVCWGLLLAPTGAGAAAKPTGHIAVWHHHHALAKTVALPYANPERPLSDEYVTISPVPESLQVDDANCLCYDVGDDRLALVHTYYYAHQMLADYDAMLRHLKLPQVKQVHVQVVKNNASPTTARLSMHHRPTVSVTYPEPTVDQFTLAHALGRVIDLTISPRGKGRMQHPLGLKAQAEELGVEAAIANILAALELGQPGNLPLTSDTLDAPPANDVDTFVRFPDLVPTSRAVLKRTVRAPRFAARYADYTAEGRLRLSEPKNREALAEPDPAAASAAITQPLWQAAERFGFGPVKELVLTTIAHWQPAQTTYVALATELTARADNLAPRCAAFLREEYARRGLLPEQRPPVH